MQSELVYRQNAHDCRMKIWCVQSWDKRLRIPIRANHNVIKVILTRDIANSCFQWHD